eukprot:TRINITY_DN1049_c0_g1_i1.p1 TRINITY_DN1049_c0_g1~~TRINITY_DN1049_c0_g1_i1.p1  ORF type:complete len:364 (+),score=92.60 TRINITY_DN1049_c0_g1_i1:34-1125(+)
MSSLNDYIQGIFEYTYDNYEYPSNIEKEKLVSFLDQSFLIEDFSQPASIICVYYLYLINDLDLKNNDKIVYVDEFCDLLDDVSFDQHLFGTIDESLLIRSLEETLFKESIKCLSLNYDELSKIEWYLRLIHRLYIYYENSEYDFSFITIFSIVSIAFQIDTPVLTSNRVRKLMKDTTSSLSAGPINKIWIQRLEMIKHFAETLNGLNCSFTKTLHNLIGQEYLDMLQISELIQKRSNFCGNFQNEHLKFLANSILNYIFDVESNDFTLAERLELEQKIPYCVFHLFVKTNNDIIKTMLWDLLSLEEEDLITIVEFIAGQDNCFEKVKIRFYKAFLEIDLKNYRIDEKNLRFIKNNGEKCDIYE